MKPTLSAPSEAFKTIANMLLKGTVTEHQRVECVWRAALTVRDLMEWPRQEDWPEDFVRFVLRAFYIVRRDYGQYQRHYVEPLGWSTCRISQVINNHPKTTLYPFEYRRWLDVLGTIEAA